MTFYDFLYLNTDRNQSILAQLEKGLIEQFITNKTTEGELSTEAGILAKLLPISGTASYQHSFQTSKVLHDYAFMKAMSLLKKHHLLMEITGDGNAQIPMDYSGFILVKGLISILDYSLLMDVLNNQELLVMFGIAEGQGFTTEQLKQFVKTFLGESLHVRLVRKNGSAPMIGPLNPDYLREDIRNFIFKYGSNDQKKWTMLAQVNSIPTTNGNINTRLETLSKEFGSTFESNTLQGSQFSTFKDIFDKLLEFLTGLQETIASVSHPAIAVTPVGIYREIEHNS